MSDVIRLEGISKQLGEREVLRDEARRKVGFVLESDGLYDNKTAEENLWYYARIYGMAESAERIDRILNLALLNIMTKRSIAMRKTADFTDSSFRLDPIFTQQLSLLQDC